MKKIGYMGVINITPDSFSDGDESYSSEKFKKKLEELKQCDYIDVGAESTAPFNDPIDIKEEVRRIRTILFPNLLKIKYLSVDTYKYEVFKMVYDEVNGRIPIIWNDVSGQLDSHFMRFIKECPDATYVYSHSLVPRREETSHHMTYAKNIPEDVLFKDAVDYFKNAYEKFIDLDVLDRVIFDPCFGFSKTRTQNQYLVKNFKKLVLSLPSTLTWLVGISRKSFLRYLDKDSENLILQTELLQMAILSKISNEIGINRLIFRMHDSLSIRMMKQLQEDFIA